MFQRTPDRSPSRGEDRKAGRPPWAWIAFGLLVFLAAQWLLRQAAPVQVLPYSEFVRELKDGRVTELRVLPDRIDGTLQSDAGSTRFTTVRVDPALAGELERYGVRFSGMPGRGFWTELGSWIPMFVLAGLWWLVLRGGGRGSLGGGLLSIGRSRARVFAETDVKVTFDDVAGVDEAKAELEEVVAFLRDPRGRARLGARMPKGILLVGPPGTGKTLLARAVAGQAGVPFFSINGSEFVELFVGVGAARVRDLFEQARRSAPCIVFIDEVDALGRARGAWSAGGQDEKEQTLNQLLAELDGFDPSSGVVLLAATNRPEVLDPALLRAGRFDRQVPLDRPDRTGRAQILRVHLQRVQLGPDVQADAVAALTPGFTGADLANLVNEAALAATRRNAPAVAMPDFTAALERILAGPEKRNRVLNVRERRAIAVHEMGHALVASALPGQDKVSKVSIIPRGIGSLGYTLQRPTEDRYLMTRQELQDRMAVLLAGRAAEELLLDDVSTGAEDDLVHSTDIARSMVMRFGMDGGLGPVAYERAPSPLLPLPPGVGAAPHAFAEATGREIDRAVQALATAAAQRAGAILASRKALLQQASELLLQRETLADAELQQLLAAVPGAAPESRVERAPA